jgi:predicted CoA-binding protein
MSEGRLVTDPEEAAAILRNSRVIAVIGASGTPGKDAYNVPVYLIQHGYKVIPVNPKRKQLYGLESYPSFGSIPREIRAKVDIVDVFRPQEEGLQVVHQVEEARVDGSPRIIWFQLDTDSDEAVEYALERGFTVVRGMCIKRVHMKWLSD